MATLEKIRSKGVLLLVVVGIALLAFMIGDLLNSGASFFNQSSQEVAQIVGESIHINDYSAAIDQMTEVYKIETGQSDFNEELQAQLRTSVWESLVNEKLLGREAEKVGLTVTPEELSDRLFGNNIHPIIAQRRMFADETGRFNPAALVQFLNSLDMEPQNAEMEAQIRQAKNYWLFWEKSVRNSVLQEKYTNLLTASVTANTLEAKESFNGRNSAVNVQYVMQPYFAIADSAVAVSNSEIKALYAKKKEQYKQTPNRSLQYVAFNVLPSAEDFEIAEEWINKLKPEFETTDEVVELVNSNSDVLYDGYSYSEMTIPAYLKEFAFSGKKNEVSELFSEENTYSIARIMETGYQQPDSVKLRHIFMMGNDQTRIDSVVNAIKRGANFGTLALQYSMVEQTAMNGGEIGWVTERTLTRDIATPAFTKATQEVFVVESGQGTQIMQVMERSKPTPKVKVAILAREVTASSKTYGILYNNAKQFVVNNSTSEKFEEAAREQGLPLHPAYNLNKNSDRVLALNQSRPIVRWAFSASLGEVSDVFECGDSFVVATVTDIKDGDYRSLNDVSNELRAELVKEKKAALMIKEMAAVLAKNNTLEAAAEHAKAEIQEAEAVSMSAYRFGAAGMEPYLIGWSAANADNTLSAPLKGNSGIYVVKNGVKSQGDDTLDMASEIMQLNMRNSYSLTFMAIEKLREKADITDNRANFY